MSNDPPAARSGVLGEWLRGWPAVATSTVGMTVVYIHLYTTGLFIQPLGDEFGWGRAQITLGLTIVSVVSVVLSPFGGALVDRFGIRGVGVPALVVYCGAITALSFTGPSIWSWWIVWALLGFGSACLKPTIWTIAVASRFDAGRGFALSVALCGGGISSALLPVLTNHLFDAGGWRFAYRVMGLGGALLIIPLMIWVFRPGVKPAAAVLPTGEGAAAPMRLRDQFRQPNFLRLASVSALKGAAVGGVMVHFVPLLTDGGLSREAAVGAAAFIGLGSIGGRLVTGVLVDRFGAGLIGGTAFVAPMLGSAALLLAPTWALTPLLAAVTIGISLGGGTSVLAYSATRCFSPGTIGMLLGTMFGLMSLATGLGPLVLGAIYDATNSYDLGVMATFPFWIAAAFLMFTMGREPARP